MLSEEALERLSERLIRRIEELNTIYVNTLGEQLNTIGKLTPTQLAQLFQTIKYGGDLDKIVKKVSEITRLNVNDIYSMFEEVAKTNQNYSKKFYEYKNTKFIPYEKNKELQNYVKSMADITVNDYINLSKTMAYSIYDGNKTKYTSLSETYQTITDRAILEITQGRDSYEQSIKKAMKELTEKGLRTVDYASGYSRRLDSSVRMNIMDGLSRLSMNLQEKFGEEFGADGIEVSHHVNPAPDHEDTVDGRQFSKNGTRVVNGIEYKDFNEINNKLTRHVGEMNCYHITYSIVLGISNPLFTNEELENDKLANAKGFEFEGKHYTMYEGTQLQRQIETKIRQYKERQIGAESIENLDEVFKCQKRIRQLTDKYNELHKVSGLSTRIERLRVDNYKKVSKKTLNNLFEDNIISKDFEKVNKNVETLIIYDRNTKDKIYNATDNKKSSVGGLKALSIFVKSKPNTLVSAHNHPSNSSFSLKDIMTFNRFDSINSIFVDTEGYTYFLEKKYIKKINSKYLNKTIVETRNIYYNKFGKNKETLHLANKEIANRMGWNYGRIEKK